MISNANGRALEYCLCNMILSHAPNSIIDDSNSTIQDQLRDKVHFDRLPERQKKYYEGQSLKFINAYLLSVITGFLPPLIVRRMNDNDAKLGDVADIKIISDSNQEYGISLKHNHAAVKHQRPGALIKQLGISVNDKAITKSYKAGIKAIELQFYEKVKALHVDKNLFNVVKAKNPQVILGLYHSICSHVADTINKFCKEPDVAKSFFEFLVGKFNFDKVIVTEHNVKVMKFNDIELPTAVLASVRNDSYVDLIFDNGFEFSMRLHTASSKFEFGKAVSLKFDTQLSSEVIPSLDI